LAEETKSGVGMKGGETTKSAFEKEKRKRDFRKEGPNHEKQGPKKKNCAF